MRLFRFFACVAAVATIASCSGDPTTAPGVVGPGRFTLVSAGGAHACALDTLRRAWCWGSNGKGAVGIALRECAATITGTSYTGCIVAPTLVATNLQFKTISAGRNHTCALTDAGAAYCWGSNATSQLGVAAAPSSCSGTPCSGLPVEVSGGFTFQSIAAGETSTCGITTTGVGKCWGNLLGPISGDGTPARSSTPTTVRVGGGGDSLWSSIDRPDSAHACGINGSDRPLCWGDGANGQLGTSDTPLSVQPPLLTAAGVSMSTVVTGSTFSCGLDADGAAFCWGAAYRDGLGTNEANTGVSCGTASKPYTCYYVPTRVQGARRFSSLSGGVAHVCGIAKDLAESRCWGNDVDYAIGVGVSPFVVPVPYATAGEHPFSSVSAGDQFACGVTKDANVWCWGSNRSGQLGIHPLQGRLYALLYSSVPMVVAASSIATP